MDKENKRLISEIIFMIIFLLVVIPICVSASTSYNDKKNKMQCISNISIDILSEDSNKLIRLDNLGENKVNVNLILRISKFYGKYMVELDNNKYNLNDMFYNEDEEYYYYNLGVYEISEYREFEFRLIATGDNVYDDEIVYSFMTEVGFC